MNRTHDIVPQPIGRGVEANRCSLVLDLRQTLLVSRKLSDSGWGQKRRQRHVRLESAFPGLADGIGAPHPVPKRERHANKGHG